MNLLDKSLRLALLGGAMSILTACPTDGGDTGKTDFARIDFFKLVKFRCSGKINCRILDAGAGPAEHAVEIVKRN